MSIEVRKVVPPIPFPPPATARRAGPARWLGSLLVAAVLVLASCDSSTDPDRAARGDATVEVSGDIEDSFSAGALHISMQVTGESNGDLSAPADTAQLQAVNFLPSPETVGRFELARVTQSEGFDGGGGALGEADAGWGPFEPGTVEDEWILFAVLDDLRGYSGVLFSTGGSISLPQATGDGQVSGMVDAAMQGELTRDGTTEVVRVQVAIEFESLPSTGGF